MSSPLVVNSVQCSGTETRLIDCPYLSNGCMMQAALQCYERESYKTIKSILDVI